MDLSELKGIGPVRADSLRAMGISSLRDLLYTLPVRYEDRITVYPCNTKSEGNILISGIIDGNPRCSYFRGISRVNATIRDETGTLSVCWYNEPWIFQQLHIGQPLMLYGRMSVRNNRRCLQNPQITEEKCILPVYHSIKGFPAKSFRKLITDALLQIDDCCPETLPVSFRRRYHLCELNYAIRQAHFPEDQVSLNIARRRLSFENVLIYLAYVSLQTNHREPGYSMNDCRLYAEEFTASLPFSLTKAQLKVIYEIADDLEKGQAMTRLVQGDVGCGKTIVAFASVYIAVRNRYQAAMMAPTEILAQQHYENARSVLEHLGIRCCLLTGSTHAKERKSILDKLSRHECDVIFGTHALISKDVEYAKLGLVITDEQHRFGVKQRSDLQTKGSNNQKLLPHVLVMSATPIPRSLALILYGDLDLSVIDEMPAGRKPVKTFIVPEEKRKDMYHFLRKQIKEGKQAYVVCPLAEDSENGEDVKSARAVFESLKDGELKGLNIALTWGNQKSNEKGQILKNFSDGKIQVLVSTTVIEVGINVPNATVMIIENAGRFGLSQLHQLRGRVGRGAEDSWCFFLSEETEKLRIMCSTNNGFIIAQKDLELRGPGDILGTRQSGDATIGLMGNTSALLLDEVSKCIKELNSNPAYREELNQVNQLAEAYFAQNGHRIARN